MMPFRNSLFRSMTGVMVQCKASLPRRGMEEFFDSPPTKEGEIFKTGRLVHYREETIPSIINNSL